MDTSDPKTEPVDTTAAKPTPRKRALVFGLVVLVVGAAAVALTVFVLPRLHSEPKGAVKEEPKNLVTVQLVENTSDTIVVPADVRKALGIEGTFDIDKNGKVIHGTNGKKSGGFDGTFKVEKAATGKPMLLPGSTALAPNKTRRIRSRFQAEVVEVMQVPEVGTDSEPIVYRDLAPGDQVYGGEKPEVLANVFGFKIKRRPDVLAVVWSVEVGMRKSDLADAIVQLRLDEQRLKDRTELWKNGNLPRDLLDQTRRDVITDENTVARAERNLEVWKVPEWEIKEVRDEAEAAYLRGGIRDRDKEKRWARSELVAPITGTLIESNIGGKGEYLPDSTVNLFTIVDVNRIQVMAYPSEEQLQKLMLLNPGRRNWSVMTAGADPIDAPIDDISYLIDPNQHTGVVKGYITNPGKRVRGGQFVTAAVTLPAPPGVVEVPLTALAEDGRLSFVFVQSAAGEYKYRMQRVQVYRRFEQTAYVRSELTQEDQDLNARDKEAGLPLVEPLRPGDSIVCSGVLELRAALEDLASKVAKKK